MRSPKYRTLKRFHGCGLRKPCGLCDYYMNCLESWWDSCCVVLPDGTHGYSRKEALGRDCLRPCILCCASSLPEALR